MPHEKKGEYFVEFEVMNELMLGVDSKLGDLKMGRNFDMEHVIAVLVM